MKNNYFSSEGLFLGKLLSLEGFEKKILGNFYLPLQDLLTHIFICGVTGSGKTVFGKAIVEELALKEVPSILIDLKGDLSSLGLLFDKISDEFFELWSEAGIRVQNPKEKAKQEFKNHLRQLNKMGLSEDYIKKLKESSEIAVFTPLSSKGIPLAISSLADPPENINELYDVEQETIITMIDSLVNSLVDRLYIDEKISRREKEKKFLSELILYSWLNEVGLEGLEGLVRLIELVDNPPIEEVGILPIDEYISPKQRRELVQKLNGLLVGVEQLWYKGVPLDIDLLCGKHNKTNKTQISIINLTDLDSFEDRCFVVSRIAYSIYNWMRKQGGATSPRLVFYIDEIGGGGKRAFYPSYPFNVASKPAINLLLRQGRSFGVCCIFATQNPGNVDYKGLSNCGTWVVGKLSTKRDRDKILEGISEADVKFKEIDKLITSPDVGEFLIKLSSGEVGLIKERWLTSFHRTLPSLLLPKVLSKEVKENFKAFYLPDRIPGQKWFSKISAKLSTLTPETIFENFNFGVRYGKSFVLDIEPEEAIKWCLQELQKEGISPKEINFKNAQLLITRVHRGDWKVDKVIHNSQGTVIDHIKDSGIYSRFDAPLKLNRGTKEDMTNMVKKMVTPRSLEICKKVDVLLPESNRLTKMEVRTQISKKVNVPYKDIQVFINEQNIAFAWKFEIEYREKNIECFIDIINHDIKLDFPIFSKEEVIDEIRKLYPTFMIKEEDISLSDSLYNINYSTEDYDYVFKVSKKSCKVLKERISFSEKRARLIAMDKVKKEPYSIWKGKKTWNFYYKNGIRLIINDKNGNVIIRNVISEEKAVALANNIFSKATGENDLSITNKDFKNGRWFINFKYKKMPAYLEIGENGKVLQNIRLQQVYCLEEAKKILKKNKIYEIILKSSNRRSDGWEFEFSSSFAELIVRIDSKGREFLKRNITKEGAIHFVKQEIGGEIISINEKTKIWDILLKKQGKDYRIELSKHDNSIKEVKVKKFLFWKKISLNDIKNNIN